MPVIKIIGKCCFLKENPPVNSSAGNEPGPSNEQADPYNYEYIRMRIPMYSTVAFLKESVIKWEARYFALEQRQLAVSIKSMISTSDPTTEFEENFDLSYDRKLLIECHELIRHHYENDLPVFVVLWSANLPAPRIQVLTPAHEANPASTSMQQPEPSATSRPETSPQPEQASSSQSAETETPALPPPDLGPLPGDNNDLILEESVPSLESDESDEQVEETEESIVLAAPRTTLVESAHADASTNTIRVVTDVSPTSGTDKTSHTLQDETEVRERVWQSQPSSMGDDFSFLHSESLMKSATIRASVQRSAVLAMASSRVTISDVLLEQQLWVAPDVLKEGWLQKRMRYSQKNEMRWVQLRLDHHLYYYKERDDPVPLGKIPLAISTLELPLNAQRVTTFQLYYTLKSKERRVVLSSEKEEETLAWIDILNRTMNDAKETYSASIAQEGYLFMKRAAGLKTWNKRYFILKDGKLTYWMEAEDARLTADQPRGKISLDDCYMSLSNTSSAISPSGNAAPTTGAPLSTTTSTNTQATPGTTILASATPMVVTNHIFRLHVSNETILFMASSESEMQQWLKAITSERDSLKEYAHLKLAPSATSVAPLPSDTTSSSLSFAPFDWNSLQHTTRVVPTVFTDLPFDEGVAEHVDMPLISSLVDMPQLRLLRHHYAHIRQQIIKDKAKLNIFDVLLAPLTKIPPSRPLPDILAVRYHFGESSVSAKCPMDALLIQGLAMAVNLMVRRKIFPEQARPADYVVKLCGARQFILDLDTPFCDIEYVREQVLTQQRPFVELMLYTRAAFLEEVSSNKWMETLDSQFAAFTASLPQNPDDSVTVDELDTPVNQDDDIDQLMEHLTGATNQKRDAPASPSDPNDIKDTPLSSTPPAAPTELTPSKKPQASSSDPSLAPLLHWVEEKCYDVSAVRNHTFSLRVMSLKNFSYTLLDTVVPHDAVDNSKAETRISFFIQACIFYGNRVVAEAVKTAQRLTPYFNQVLSFHLSYYQLAPEMRIGFTLFVNHAGKNLPLAWCNLPITDYAGRLRQGACEFSMWVQPKQAHPVGSCESDCSQTVTLCLEFERTPVPLAFLDFDALPPLYELPELQRCAPLHGPYKSEIMSFVSHQSKLTAHPLLGDNSVYALSNRLEHRANARFDSTPSQFPHLSRPRSVAYNTSPMSQKSAIVLGASRTTPTSSSTTSSRPPTDESDSQPASSEHRDLTSSASSSDSSNASQPPRKSSQASDSGSQQASAPKSRRARKSFTASAAPPMPIGANFPHTAALSTPPLSSSPPSSPMPATQPTTLQPASQPSSPLSLSSGALMQFSSAFTASSPSLGNLVRNTSAPSSIRNADPAPATPELAAALSNTIWANTFTKANLHVVAREILSGLTAERFVAHLQEIDRICKLDPLTPLTETNKQLLWAYRRQLVEKPETFPKLFLSANILNPSTRTELHNFVATAPLMQPEMALQLLDHKYPDSHVRTYAVRCLVAFSDEGLASYLLQLVQVLQYESLYLAPLASFLVERAILNPPLIGQSLLWHLQAELHRPETATKFGLLIEALLMGLKPASRAEFTAQIDFVARVTELNNQLQTVPPASRTAYLRKTLASIFSTPTAPSSDTSNTTSTSQKLEQTAPASAASRLVLPLSSAMVVKGMIFDKCKVMDSAAFPLWLCFENEDPFADPIFVLFKFGDDLRQDTLTLQMFGIMDRLWKQAGLDLKMSVYKCLPTGPNMGMIEVVMNAETSARIQKEAGGIIGAFKQTPLFNWLKSYNQEGAMLQDALKNFMQSCAAYCVATYVIGVGDRHNDNIMVTKSGKLFHIDFAHFLGNIIKFGVYKRERAPFVLTPEFAYVMGGEKSSDFAEFRQLCCRIYNLLRRHSSTFISLFELMLFAGLTQLSSHEDLAYLKKSLLTTGTSESEAEETFSRLIDESLSTKSTQLNFAIHIFAHPD